MKGEPFEIDGARLGLGLALQRLCRNADMGGRLDVDAALGIGAAVDADFQSGKCQMVVLEVEPSLPLFEEFRFLTGPQLVLDFPGLHPNWLTIRPHHGDLLGPEPVLGQRT
jgi:hypothetical protein